MEELKRFSSGKHKLYGYMVDVSVTKNGLSVGSSDSYPGSVADFEVFKRQKYFHVEQLRKT